jgi:hypothetical protein
LPRVFLDKLPSRQVARENSAGKTGEAFWKTFAIVKIADALFINRAVFHRNGNARFVHTSAFVARSEDAELTRRVARSGG